ncbi:hypothetical protein [Runella limosa]|uniref:hypothetical protein n=1 Tax=Runella limosa TaxID=370978 RepID=UPI0012FA821A|nr:hypothetical protein [Runella limosa]
MRKKIYLILLFIASMGCAYAQPQQTLDANELFLKQNPQYRSTFTKDGGRYLVLDVYRMGKIRRHRFFVGDELTFSTKQKRKKSKQTIVAVSDSSFTYSTYNDILGEYEHTEVMISDVHKIRLSRNIPFVTQGAVMLPLAGGVLLLTDTFITKGGVDFLVQFDPKTALIAGGIASLGILCAKASFPKYRVGGKHQLKVLKVY